jgi:hypothetical protein
MAMPECANPGHRLGTIPEGQDCQFCHRPPPQRPEPEPEPAGHQHAFGPWHRDCPCGVTQEHGHRPEPAMQVIYYLTEHEPAGEQS